MNNPVPPNHEGTATNTEDVLSFENVAEAKSFFERVKQRLFSVNRWHEYAGNLTADFELTDGSGAPVSRRPEKGDYFKIGIPAPGPASGEGYDWVLVEETMEEHHPEGELAAIRVRPAPSPVNESQDVAHFFSGAATSSFIVKREHQKVTAGVYGRNEKPNTATDTLADKIRNVAVAAGAISGFSKLQWKSLVSGLLKDEA